MKTFLIILSLFIFSAAHAQKDSSFGKKVKGDLKAAGKTVAKGAKAVGNKTAEISSKGASKVVDKTYDGKTGPHGQTIFINKHSHYYWVDKKGKRHYITEDKLIDKV